MPDTNSLQFSERYHRLADELREGPYTLDQLEIRYKRLTNAATGPNQAVEARLLWAQALIANRRFGPALSTLGEARSFAPGQIQQGMIDALTAKTILLMDQPRESLPYITAALRLLAPWPESNETRMARALNSEIAWRVKYPNPGRLRRLGHFFTKSSYRLMVAEVV